MVHGWLSCSAACGIFSDQRLNLGLLHGQVKFFTTEPPGKPKRWYLNADGKEPAEREGADPGQRRGTTDGAVSPRREGSGDQPLGSGVTDAVQSWGAQPCSEQGGAHLTQHPRVQRALEVLCNY